MSFKNDNELSTRLVLVNVPEYVRLRPPSVFLPEVPVPPRADIVLLEISKFVFLKEMFPPIPPYVFEVELPPPAVTDPMDEKKKYTSPASPPLPFLTPDPDESAFPLKLAPVAYPVIFRLFTIRLV